MTALELEMANIVYLWDLHFSMIHFSGNEKVKGLEKRQEKFTEQLEPGLSNKNVPMSLSPFLIISEC